jgi:hypothetical protein
MFFLTLFRRLKGSVRTSAFEQSMDAELRHHLELETDALIARGCPRRGTRPGAPAFRQHRAGQGRLPRVVGPALRAAAIDPMRALRAE